jgi:crotonobetainyl-CoA:carnitine CoA-transferase CaiB-like acyl-CoA transferase
MPGVLEGLKVIEMGQIEAVPVAAAWMADWGADVIKVEPPEGESWGMRVKKNPSVSRVTGPRNFLPDDVRRSVYNMLNRNKKGLALDLKTEQGREIVYKLVENADVFLSNYRRDALNNLKMDYATLKQLNPRLIYAILSAYGSKGPDKDMGGSDLSAGWFRSGWADFVREPGGFPFGQTFGFIDRGVAGPQLTAGIMAALLHREKTGEGQELEVSLFHSCVWAMAFPLQIILSGSQVPKRGRENPQNPINSIYRTGDNRCFQFPMAQPEHFWSDFCQAIEKPELENDPRFESIDKRSQNSVELTSILDETFASRTIEEWSVQFEKYNISLSRIQTLTDVVNDPQALANNFFVEVPHSEKKIKVVATPVNFYQNMASVRTPTPEVGEHNEEILSDLGYSEAEINELKENGVIPQE